MLTILIVEDEQEVREGIKKHLFKSLNCQIKEANNGEEALEKIKNNNFDLIILDIKLPGLSGIDILKSTKEKSLDFLVISGWDSLSVAKEALRYGAADYLSKPFSMDILGLKVEEILSKKNKKGRRVRP